ncbi:MAG: hypothetical protein ABGX16_08955, partial [Pirellulales bacterium]
FKLYNRKTGKMWTVKMQWASSVLCDIGEAARAVVSDKGGKVKYAPTIYVDHLENAGPLGHYPSSSWC